MGGDEVTEYAVSWWEYTGRRGSPRAGVSSPIFRNLETGEERMGSQLPPGACYDRNKSEDGSDRRYRYPVGADGLSIVCVLPGNHHWGIDGPCSNCALPEDKEHRCWVRHGTLGDKLHVDKNGHTCSAGGGSIAITDFHGFLHHGVLKDC